MKIKVFTWNYGKNSEEKLQRIQNYVRETVNYDVPDILVIGLQEVHHHESKKVGNKLRLYLKSKLYKGHIYEQGVRNYTLLTGIFFRNHISFEEAPPKHLYIEAKATFVGRVLAPVLKTKGALSVLVNFQNIFTGERLSCIFVNVHLPFDSMKLTEKALYDLVEHFDWDARRQKVIIFGDVNSRSLMDDSCLIKAYENPYRPQLCEGVEYKKNVPYDSVTILESELNKCSNSYDDQCKILSSNLQYNDVLKRQLKVLQEFGFVELDLYALPSYKKQVDGTRYVLQKKGKGRLAGYADRIFFSPFFTGSGYNMLKYEGNDHWPVVVTLETF